MTDSLEKFFKVLEAFCAVTSLAEATVSTRIFRDGGRIDLLRRGGDVGARKLDRAFQWFADNWPEDAVWPAGVARPMGIVKTESA